MIPMSNSIVQGSLTAIAQDKNTSIAEAFVSADFIILVDVSGSMRQCDAQDGLDRYTAACNELAKLQKNLPGKVAVIAFSSRVVFCPSGVPVFEQMGTDLKKALDFIFMADGLVDRFIVISDGIPDDRHEALQRAKDFTTRIDCVYVGPESDTTGPEFLRQLSAASGGQYATADRTKELANKIERLLTAN